jgi:hypothetical protein
MQEREAALAAAMPAVKKALRQRIRFARLPIRGRRPYTAIVAVPGKG